MPKFKRKNTLRHGKRHKTRNKGTAGARGRRWSFNLVMKRAGGRCEYCGDEINLVRGDPKQGTIDHVTALSRGGLDTPENLRLACRACNEEKGAGVAVDVYIEGES